VFSPSQRSSISNMPDSPLRIRDDDESTLDNFQFDEELDLMTPDPDKKHLRPRRNMMKKMIFVN
uniref:hypothetical protein n=1 Tax=Salmonella sp. s51228 TaxID=3159652 RepID=UPI003980E8EC